MERWGHVLAIYQANNATRTALRGSLDATTGNKNGDICGGSVFVSRPANQLLPVNGCPQGDRDQGPGTKYLGLWRLAA